MKHNGLFSRFNQDQWHMSASFSLRPEAMTRARQQRMDAYDAETSIGVSWGPNEPST
jgi:hypothetical protein